MKTRYLFFSVLFYLSAVLSVRGGSVLEEPSPELAAIINFRQYSACFASSGQPTREQFVMLRDIGFQRVIYLAFTTDSTAVANEDAVVKNLGMEYLQIPVDFAKPLSSDFYAFADFMRRDTSKKTLLHCQVNARASAFSFLYRVIYEDVPVAAAKDDMNTIWRPNKIWRDFIFDVLAQNGRSPDCEGCDWDVPAAKP
jgi:protein tyrosine phosphatase (PTP) superfamily phosphohydrolase (DUF442 family)